MRIDHPSYDLEHRIAPPGTGEALLVDQVMAAMLDASPEVSVVIFDTDLHHRKVDGASLAGGRDLGATLREIAPDSSCEATDPAYRTALEGGTVTIEGETEDRGAIMRVRFSPLRDGDRIIGGIAVLRDVTAQRREQSLLADSTAIFEHSFSGAPIGMAVVAPDGRWLKVNPALCRMLGHAEATLLAGTFQDVTHPDDLETDVALVRETLDGLRDGYELEKRYLNAEGHTIWARLCVSLIRDADGAPRWFVSQMLDITARRELHGHLRRQNGGRGSLGV